MQKIGLGFIRLIIGHFYVICQQPTIDIILLIFNKYVVMGIGNSTDANLKAWDQSVKNGQAKFPEAKVVISWHGK